ncbi:UDP-N-acetylmuramoyl-L-alanyl-D-glutamate--2,6-diaminopimelate ligase [Zongyangia hominis]|uniref:UDP-N-acetylmuramoyl-L-alanyl-D-glutamate--2,6-diaminopimelate ligase n=1 Tax=Zongyangia hominis TaxID=2763677 RepID=A0A926E906_9FIRM|nr:UDP-N-acetylmuramoyl-L-alanyl-D-glutamate--2,6-diaminopimelate ligase [Zongyangia hominis]MBC8570110.1 UDP-N-acetylmuramoyl-L-alanyl-D-glutamate--2,6-diaminopimelate ligase [Zongyangia hominis]
MRLRQLLQAIGYGGEPTDCEVASVTCDSRRVEPGSVFVCIKGLKFDGHDHAQKAVEAGACAVVAEHPLTLNGCENVIVTKDTREAYALLSAAICGFPAKGLKLIGVTGTNGKTTITNLIKHILESAGKRVGLIGTIHNQIGDMLIPAKHTTPDPGELHVLFKRMAAAGCEYVVMEASSHAMDQKRLFGCEFEAAVFTNLTQDHLDYHGTMENYFEAKAKLFAQAKNLVINYDDPYGQRLIERYQGKKNMITYAVEDDRADYVAKNIKFALSSNKFALVGSGVIARVNFCMPGRFSVENALAAACACMALGLSFEEAVEGLNTCTGVRGRTEVLDTGDAGFTVICDYAHSPDGLEKVMGALKELHPKRLVALFGCAGNRDRTKRPKMTAAVAKYADFAIFTSDNPRDEDPMQIIEDGLPGFEEYKIPYKVIVDRYQAIQWALDHAQPGDLLVLAGKGHEDYQVLDFGTIGFDEHEIVKDLLQKKKNKAKS